MHIRIYAGRWGTCKDTDKRGDLYTYSGGTPNLHSLWLLNSATRTLQWSEVPTRWEREWQGRGAKEGTHDARCRDATMPLQRCTIVRCRRTVENGVDLPRGQKFFSFSTSVHSSPSPPLSSYAFTPFAFLFHLYARA